MSYRARLERIAFIHRRLKHKRDYPSARRLAEDYGREAGDPVSDRTIKRDIELMRDRGAPIVYEESRHGYYYTDETYELPAMAVTEGELLAVLVAERALSSYRNSPFYERLREVFERLTGLLPKRVTVHSTDLASRVSVITEPVTDIASEVWNVLQSCLEEERTAVLHYRKPGYEEAALRIVDPYHMVAYRGEWYVIGYSHHDGEVRIYALSRVTSCKPHSWSFTRPVGFDPAAYIDPAFGVFLGGEEQEIAVRFDASVAPKIAERRWHPNQRIEPLADGAIILRYRTNQLNQTLFWVSQWGPNAEILAPPALRRRAAEWLEAAAGRYR